MLAPPVVGYCHPWEFVGVARGPVWVIDWHWHALPPLKCALPKIATLGARVWHDAGTFAHEEGHHRVRRGRLGLELASLPTKANTGVGIDPLISAVSELFAALRAAVGRMLMAPTPSIQYGKGGDFSVPIFADRCGECGRSHLLSPGSVDSLLPQLLAARDDDPCVLRTPACRTAVSAAPCRARSADRSRVLRVRLGGIPRLACTRI